MAMDLAATLTETNATFPETDVRLPALFVGHGSPTNAIEDNEFSRGWKEVAREVPRPKPSSASPLTGKRLVPW